jgi:hypothetical protein
MRFSAHARERMRERNVTEDEVSAVLNEHDVRFADRKGNPCYVRQLGDRRVKVVVAQDDTNFVITVIDLDA